jgi:hypothetical protein
VANDINLLSSRRAYEFKMDDLRLSAVCSVPVREALRTAFNFEIVQVISPNPTFGEVPSTAPPGLVCAGGAWVQDDGSLVPIRFINFELRRIVIEVSGPTSAIDIVYSRVEAVLGEVVLAGKSPLVGEPIRTRDHSDFTIELSSSLAALFPEPLVQSVTKALALSDQELDVAPLLHIEFLARGQELSGIPGENLGSVELAVRVLTKASDRICYSGMSLDSDSHARWLKTLALLPERSGAQ